MKAYFRVTVMYKDAVSRTLIGDFEWSRHETEGFAFRDIHDGLCVIPKSRIELMMVEAIEDDAT